MKTLWRKEENWPTPKKALEIWRNPAVNRFFNEDPVPQMTVPIFLQRIGSKPIKFYNASPLRNKALLPQRQVKYVEDIIVTGDTANLGMSRKEVIKMISGIRQASYYVQL